MKKTAKSGAGTDEVKLPPKEEWALRRLAFMKDHISVREGKESDDIPDPVAAQAAAEAAKKPKEAQPLVSAEELATLAELVAGRRQQVDEATPTPSTNRRQVQEVPDTAEDNLLAGFWSCFKSTLATVDLDTQLEIIPDVLTYTSQKCREARQKKKAQAAPPTFVAPHPPPPTRFVSMPPRTTQQLWQPQQQGPSHTYVPSLSDLFQTQQYQYQNQVPSDANTVQQRGTNVPQTPARSGPLPQLGTLHPSPGALNTPSYSPFSLDMGTPTSTPSPASVGRMVDQLSQSIGPVDSQTTPTAMASETQSQASNESSRSSQET